MSKEAWPIEERIESLEGRLSAVSDKLDFTHRKLVELMGVLSGKQDEEKP